MHLPGVGFGPDTADAVPAAPAARARRRRVVVVGVVVAVLLLGGGVGAWLLAASGDGGQSGGREGRESQPSEPSEPSVDALPERYVGEWEGDMVIPPGVPAGPMTVTLTPGRVGERVGTARNSDVLGLSTCVDVLTLAEVRDARVVLDARVDPERSRESVCAQGDFQYVIEPRGENAIHYRSTHPDSATEGTLERVP